MESDLMLFYILFLLSITINISFGQSTTIYVIRGDTAELCDNRSTLIYAYEYQSFDGKTNLIVEPAKDDRYSNPYRTSLLRINNVNENDSGLYKCPQDDTEWQKLQVYVPVENVYLSNLHVSSRILNNDLCGLNNKDCLFMHEDEPLDIVCAADGYPRPALDITFDKNGTSPTIMALASSVQPPSIVDNQFKQSVYETYRITGLTPLDNGRNITCHVDMKHIDKQLSLSITKRLYIEFRPIVAEKVRRIYSGINHTRTINCTVLRANPTYIRYTLHGLPPSIIHPTNPNSNSLQYTVDIAPTSIEQFRQFNITANNSVGFDTCTYELIHGGVPDAITYCLVDSSTSNITITISCTKSYAQGDNDGYACTLFKYNEKNNRKIFEEIARTKSCIFALENFHEPVEFRVAAFNRYGSLPINTYGYIIRLNQPKLPKDTSFFNKKIFIMIGSILAAGLLLFFACCLCGTCHYDRKKFTSRNGLYQKEKYHQKLNENELLKPIAEEASSHSSSSNGGKSHHQNGTVYDIPAHLNGKYSQSIPPNSAYHQQKPQQSANLHYGDKDSVTSSLSSIQNRARTFNNKFYGNPIIDNKYGPLSSTITTVPTRRMNPENDDDDDEEDESPVYSTTTDVMSESGSFLVPSSSSSTKRRAPPPPKPRYSTLGSVRLPHDSLDKTPLPLPKPRSRSNSRTRLNNISSDNSSYLYEERPVSSSDSGIGQTDVVCLPNGDTIRSGLVKSRQNSLQKHHIHPPYLQNQPKYDTITPSVVRGTEC